MKLSMLRSALILVAAAAAATVPPAVASARTAILEGFDVEPTEVVGGERLVVTFRFSRGDEAHVLVRTSNPEVIPFAGLVPSRGYREISRRIDTYEPSAATTVTLTAELGDVAISRTVRVLPTGVTEYELSGGDLQQAIRLAEQNGFTFETRTTGDGRCDVYPQGWVPAATGDHTLVAKPELYAVRGGGAGPSEKVCEFDMFGGRTLADGWAMLAVRLGPVHVHLGDPRQCGAHFSRIPTPKSSDPSFTVWVGHFGTRAPGPFDTDRQPHTAIAVEQIRLIGPVGAEWQDAFR